MRLTNKFGPRERFATLKLHECDDPTAWRVGLAEVQGTIFGDDYEVIFDARQVPAFDRAFASQFLGWLEAHRAQSLSARWAFLTDEGLAYGAARQLAIQGESQGYAIEAFTDVNASLQWLHRELAALPA